MRPGPTSGRSSTNWTAAAQARRFGSSSSPTSPPDGWALAIEGDTDPLGEALHRSATLTLMPGDLERWVNGEMDFEVLAR